MNETAKLILWVGGGVAAAIGAWFGISSLMGEDEDEVLRRMQRAYRKGGRQGLIKLLRREEWADSKKAANKAADKFERRLLKEAQKAYFKGGKPKLAKFLKNVVPAAHLERAVEHWAARFDALPRVPKAPKPSKAPKAPKVSKGEEKMPEGIFAEGVMPAMA